MTARVLASAPAPLPRMVVIEVDGFVCERCEHVWVPRDKNRPPKVCPKCKSPYWDRPRRRPAS